MQDGMIEYNPRLGQNEVRVFLTNILKILVKKLVYRIFFIENHNV